MDRGTPKWVHVAGLVCWLLLIAVLIVGQVQMWRLREQLHVMDAQLDALHRTQEEHATAAVKAMSDVEPDGGSAAEVLRWIRDLGAPRGNAMGDVANEIANTY